MSTPDKSSSSLLGLLVAASVFLLGSSLYVVDARDVAVVTFFGAPVRSVTEPGLKLRAPWPLHQVIRYDRRARLLDVEATEVLTKDKKNLVVEAFVVWRVADPERFLESVGTPEAAATQLGDLVVSQVAASFGQREFGDLMSVGGTAEALPDSVGEEASRIGSERLGVEVLVVRLRHVGLPLQNEQSIYERMRAERSRIANAYRSEGEEKAAAIRAEADRQVAEILAQANADAAGIEAEAEGRAAQLYADAYKADPELFLFLRRLEAAESILDKDDVVVVESGDSVLSTLLEGTP